MRRYTPSTIIGSITYLKNVVIITTFFIFPTICVFAETINDENLQTKIEENPAPLTTEKEPLTGKAIKEEMKQSKESFKKLNPETESAARSAAIDDAPPSQTATLSNGQTEQIKLLSNSGSAQYQYPIDIPVGRGNVTPSLALTYSSQSLSDMSPYGYGWDIGIPYIERLNKTGVNTLHSNDPKFYYSSFSGELVQIGTSTKYISKNELGDFIVYEFVNSTSWIVTDKTGTKYYFGVGTSSRQTNSASSSQVYSWMLEKVEDLNGNYALYTYTKDNGIIYPDTISYSNHASSSGIYSVTFTLKDTSVKTSSSYGFIAKRIKLVEKIKFYVNSQLEKDFTLNYTTGINENRDLLSGVIVSTYGTNAVTLPETKFNYEGDQLPTWANASSTSFPEPNNGEDIGVRFGDLNGDGLTDVIRYYQYASNSTSTTIRRVHLNKGDGNWDINVPWNWEDIQVPFTLFLNNVLGSGTSTNDLGTRLVDINGDGLDDIMVGYSAPAVPTYGYSTLLPLGQLGIYLNTGSGFKIAPSYGTPGFVTYDQSNSKFEYQASAFLDVNGDNLPDLVTSFFSASNLGSPQLNTTSVIALNTGTGWEITNMKFPAALSFYYQHNGNTTQDTGVRTADVNGDGLIDVMRGFRFATNTTNVNFDEVNTYLNTGNGWATSSEYALDPIYFAIPSYPQVSQSNEIADINGDGLVDIVKSWNNNGSSSYAAYINSGRGWLQKSYNLPFYLNEGFLAYKNGNTLIDFDGDTITDVWDMGYTDQMQTQTSGGNLIINNAKIPDRLTKVDLQTGGSVGLTYDGFLDTVQNNYQSIGTTSRNPVVLSKVAYDSGNQNTIETNYTYKKGYYNYSSTSIRDRKFAGFETVEITDALGKTKTFYHQGNGNSTTSNETGDDYNKIGQTYRTEVYGLNNNLFQTSINLFATSTVATGSVYTRLTQSTKLDYDGDADRRDTAVSYTYSTTTGNVLTQSQWGEVAGNQDGTFTDIGTDKRTTTYTYASNTAANIRGLLATERLDNQSGTKIKESRYYYDTLALGSANKGNLTRSEAWATSSTYINTQSSYNSYGLKTQDLDPRGNATNYVYDTYNLYPATTTNAMAQSTRYTYDYSSGKIKTTTDPNGFVHESVYDGLDRLLEQKEPRGTNGALVTVEQNTYTDTVGSVALQNKKYLDATTTVDSHIYFDGLGRPIQSRQEAETANQFTVRDTVYGSDGNITRESLPYFSTGSARTTTSAQNNLYTRYSYDALNRKIGSNTVLGTTTMAYDQWQETITDTLGNIKKHNYDAYGNLTSVLEQNGTSTYTTTYDWTPHNQLAKITDALGNIRSMQYDGLGRRLGIEDLHATADTTFGKWLFSYDAASNLATTTDPKSQVIVTTYDALNRPTAENFTGATGVEASYIYDTCTNGKGYVCTSRSLAATTTRTYNPAGLVASEQKTIGTTTYNQSYLFDRQNNQTQITYPDNSDVKYTFNTAGQLEKVEQRENGGAYRNIISNYNYGPHGQITYQLHGNGASTTKVYDENELYRLRSIVTTATNPTGGGGELAQLEAEFPLLFEDATVTLPAEAVPESADTSLSGAELQTGSLIIEEPVLATSTPSEVLETPISENVVVPAPIKLDEEKIQDIKFITNAKEAEVWRRYHKERLAYLQSSSKIDQKVIDSAAYAKERFDSYLIEKKYINTPEDEISTLGSEVAHFISKTIQQLAQIILPERAYAYLFNKEDFETCSTLPCSLSSNLAWGSAVPSLDATSRVAGVDSLKTVVTGEGGASLETANYNTSEIWSQFKIYIPANMTWGTSSYFTAFKIEDPANSTVFWMSIEDWGTPRLTVMGDVLGYTDTGLNLTPGAVNTIEIRVKTGNGTGDVDIWLNNSTQGSPSFNGNGSMNLGTDNIDDILFGMHYAPETGIATTYYDDFIVDSAFIGTSTSSSTNGTLHSGYYVYTDNVTSGWTLVPHNSTTTVSTSSVYSGNNSLKVDFSSVGYTDINLTYNTTFNHNNYLNLDLYYKTDNPLGRYIWTYYKDGNANDRGCCHIGDYVVGGFATGTWNHVIIPMSAFGTTTVPMKELIFTTGEAGVSAYFDNISFTGSSTNASTSTSTPPTPAGFVPVVQHLIYTYDSVGNITQIVDRSGTKGAATTTYTYDPLYRLLSASTTQASSTPYKETYAYNAIGNITSKSNLGTYTYAGNTGSNYANPHAPTTINSVTYNYDRNGNLASTSASQTNTWDYRNRLLTATKSGTSTTYLYDVNEQRVQKTVGGKVTRYPSQNYETVGTSTTKHIYANGTLVSTVEGVGSTSASVFHNHQDHLGSTAAVTSDIGYLTRLYNYYPYGTLRLDEGSTTTSFTQSNQFIGQNRDAEADLSYLNARYYSSNNGQFTSQDPVFWEVGQSRDGLVALYKPQLQNSYSYAADSPIVNKDPDGRFLDTIVDLGFIAYDIYSIGSAYANGQDVREQVAYLGLDVAGALTPFATGFGAVARTAKVANKTDESYSVYHGYSKVTGELEYVGITKRDPKIRFKEHQNSNTSKADLRFEVMQNGSNLSKTSARLIEQATIENKGMSKNGGSLVNKSNSMSSSNKTKAYNSASNSIKSASDAIARGDYDSASRYLAKASKKLK